jgi:virulence-associated protein VagC
MPEPTERLAKLFQNGRSQAVRLPRDFRFEGKEVRIRRIGDSVVLEPVAPSEPLHQVPAHHAPAHHPPERDAPADHAAGHPLAPNLALVRELFKSLGPVEDDLAAMLDEAMRKLEQNR